MALISGRSLGSFGALGGIVITTERFNDPDRMAFGLANLAGHIEDIHKPMVAIKAIAKADMKERFRTDTAPNGDHWQALDDDYAAQKREAGYDPTDILTRTKRLEKSATSEAAFSIMGPMLVFHTGVLPDYWIAHQEGSDASGRGALRKAVADTGGKGVTGAEMRKITAGSSSDDRGKGLPARPFIGLSTEAELQMAEVLDMWFKVGVDIHITKVRGIVKDKPGGTQLFPAF